jgi:hypothetical protein
LCSGIEMDGWVKVCVSVAVTPSCSSVAAIVYAGRGTGAGPSRYYDVNVCDDTLQQRGGASWQPSRFGKVVNDEASTERVADFADAGTSHPLHHQARTDSLDRKPGCESVAVRAGTNGLGGRKTKQRELVVALQSRRKDVSKK